MSRIIAAASAFPPHTITQSTVKATVARVFAGRMAELDRLLAVFDHARIASRQFMMPLAWYLEAHGQEERTRIYQQHGLELLIAAARQCLARADCSPGQVDHIIFVSSTGLATPTLDAHLINRLGMRATTTRTPIWGLGCAAGAVGLARAHEHCLAYPDHRVLLLALECCSLTFMAGDLTKKNLVATSLFADGAAAVLLGGEQAMATGPAILATRSHLFPDSYRMMGWEFEEEGMQLVLSPKLPLLVRTELPALVKNFLAAQGLLQSDLVHYLSHPGGARVVDAYQEALQLSAAELQLTAAVLQRHGNISSVSVLAVLEEWLASGGREESGYGLLSAFGPGFSAELLLLKV